MKLVAVIVSGVALLGAACSSSTTDSAKSPSTHTPDGSGAPDATGSAGPYPDGPYGNAVGDTLTNLHLQGYVNDDAVAISNTLPFVDSYSLEDVRASGAKYALVHVSEFF